MTLPGFSGMVRYVPSVAARFTCHAGVAKRVFAKPICAEEIDAAHIENAKTGIAEVSKRFTSITQVPPAGYSRERRLHQTMSMSFINCAIVTFPPEQCHPCRSRTKRRRLFRWHSQGHLPQN